MTEPRVTPEVTMRKATPKDDGDVARLIHGYPSPEATGIAGGSERAADLGLTLFGAGVGRSAHDETYLASLAGQPVGVLLGRCAGGNFPIPARALPMLFRSVLRLYSLRELPGLVHPVPARPARCRLPR